jgi:hypothetical protein
MIGGTYSAHEMRNAYKCLKGRPLARPIHRREDNIKIYLVETVWMFVDSYGSGHKTLTGSCENSN